MVLALRVAKLNTVLFPTSSTFKTLPLSKHYLTHLRHENSFKILFMNNFEIIKTSFRTWMIFHNFKEEIAIHKNF